MFKLTNRLYIYVYIYKYHISVILFTKIFILFTNVYQYISFYTRRLPDVWISDEWKMAACNRKYIYDIPHISACIRERKEIPTAVPMFSGSGNKTRLLRRPLDVWIREESRMADINFRLTDVFVKCTQVHTTNSFRSSLVVVARPWKRGYNR